MRKFFEDGNIPVLKVIAVFAFITWCFTSCEKEVDIDLDTEPPRLVVEGGIETGYPPFILLTKTVGFFGVFTAGNLINSYVHDAKVWVSDGTQTIELKEFTFDTGGKTVFYYYGLDTSQPGQIMVGVEEKTYTLKIEYDGQTYEAVTKIPTPTLLDSVLSVYPQPPFDKNKYPDARQLRIAFHDPDTPGNYIQYYTKRNDEMFYPGFNSVYSDELINGTQFSVNLSLGVPRSAEFTDTLGTAKVDDKVTLRWCAIDKATYDFWSTYEYSLGTLGNPFATPINVKSNISNNAIGIWAGYGSKYYTITLE